MISAVLREYLRRETYKGLVISLIIMAPVCIVCMIMAGDKVTQTEWMLVILMSMVIRILQIVDDVSGLLGIVLSGIIIAQPFSS